MYKLYEREYYKDHVDGNYDMPGLLAQELKRNMPEVKDAIMMQDENLAAVLQAGGKMITAEAASNVTAVWAAENVMHLQSSTLKFDESGKPFHIQQAEQIRLYKQAWKKAGHPYPPRVSVSRSIFALINDQDRLYFGQQGNSSDKFGMIEPEKRAVFGRSYAAEPDELVKLLAQDEAIAEADTVLLTIPNTLGVDYNVHVLSSILQYVAPGLGWR